MYHLKVLVWFEWVDSGSNWADGISRLFEKDPFASAHGFYTSEMSFEQALWSVTFEQFWTSSQRLGEELALG